MKKFVSSMLACIFSTSLTFAASSQSIAVTVTPTATSSISISPNPANAGFGNRTINTSDNFLASGFTVTNTGLLATTLQLRVNPADGVWTSSDTLGQNQYRVLAIANSTEPGPTDFSRPADFVLPTYKTCGSSFAGDQTCFNIAPSDSRTFWLLLDMPTSSTVATERSFSIEVNAI